MAFVLECRFRDSVDFTGPFDSRVDAEIYGDLPLPGGILYCQREHTVHELIVPNVSSIRFDQLITAVLSQREQAREATINEMARNSIPFGVGNDGRIENDNGIIAMYGIVNPIATIKELRTRYPGLGLKEAKEIVEKWHDDSNATTRLFGK